MRITSDNFFSDLLRGDLSLINSTYLFDPFAKPHLPIVNRSIMANRLPQESSEVISDQHSSKNSESPELLLDCHVLAIDDDPVALCALERHLVNRGCRVTTASNGRDGLEQVTLDMSVALVDMKMPDLSGLDCLKYLREHHPEIRVIIVTASSDVDSAVSAMQEGAFQYVTKPFGPDSLVVHVQKAHEASQLSRENQDLRQAVSFSELPAKLVNEQSDFAAELIQSIERIASLDSTVFVGGESGTGKTTVARLIHQSGPRSKGPFVAINCASLPRDLIESELFGHSKGAFTGAIKDRIGKAELANGGTLFLDEIGDLPIELQPKLLTFLQDRVIQRVGCNIERALDVRLIVATHRDLTAMCNENRFRQDLYYRLNVLSLYLPPLRQRGQALIQIAKSLTQQLCQRLNRAPIILMDSAIDALRSHDWPGNIRELENVLERAIVFSQSNQLAGTDFEFDAVTSTTPEKRDTHSTSRIAGKTLEEIEKLAILETLDACNGNKAKTARMLGISEKSIYNKMKRLGISYSKPTKESHE